MIKLLKRIVTFFLDHLRTKKITKVTQNNIEFIVETQDKLGEEWNLINDYDLSEFQIFKGMNIDKDQIKKVYYFGAHQCVIPIKIQKIFLDKSDFYCFEAIKRNYLIGNNNITHNKCEDKVHLFNEALSTNNGHEYFDSVSMNSFKTQKKLLSTKVRSSDLETLINRHGKGEILYFDIEGLEGQVLQKSISFLKTWKNYLFIEAHGIELMKKYDFTNKKLFNLLKDNNYATYKLSDDYQTNNEKFIKVDNSDDIPEKRFYLFPHNH